MRYADDIVAGFEHEADARQFWDAMRLRFGQFSLELHGDKTRLLEFGRHAAVRRKRSGLLHHVTVEVLWDAFLALKRHAAPGLDGVTWDDYAADLESNLQDLHTRIHGGTYRALRYREHPPAPAWS